MREQGTEYPTNKLELDHSVDHTANESQRHWAIKAAIVAWLRSHPGYEGTIQSEKKIGDQIGDVRCEFSRTPDEIPQQCVFEVQTAFSEKNYLSTTQRYLRFGYAVFWVFAVDAYDQRREAEERLSEYLCEPASFGIASLDDGELQLGRPITPEKFDAQSTPESPLAEFYIPTYDRYGSCFDHGDFEIGEDQVAILSVAGETDFYYSRVLDEDGQRSLPQRAMWNEEELWQGLQENTISRLSPVRGPP